MGLLPGSEYREELVRWTCCVYQIPVAVTARYYVDPTEKGVSVDPADGTVKVTSDTWPGTKVRLYAVLEGGRRIISQDIYIFTPESNPFVGVWRQTAERLCIGNIGFTFDVPPARQISEIVFRADGTYSVTWTPFEVYRDYWGPYTYDQQRKRLILGITWGSFIPDNFLAQGEFEFSATTPTELVLKGIWFGKQTSIGGLDGCGAVLTKVR